MSRPRIGLVGAGVTGLALTHYLRAAGAEPVTFEATDRPGGVVRSETAGGRVLERGPQRLRLSGPLADLVDELGLADETVAADTGVPLYVCADGDLRRVPLSPRSYLTTDLLSWRGKLRVLAEPLTGAGRPAETAAELFRRKFGDEAYENVIAPLYGGIYASDPAEMPARHALARLLQLERTEGNLLRPALSRLFGGERAPAVAIEGGNQRLPAALYEAHADHVRLSTPVERVEEAADGFELVAAGDRVAVDEVVVTVPADAAAEVLAPLAPNAERLADLDYNPLAMVYLLADHDREGLGYQVRHGDDLRTLGVSWNGPAFGDNADDSEAGGDPARNGVHTAFLGGMTDAAVLERSDGELADLARREFEAVMGVDAEVVDVARPEWGFPAWNHSWSALEDLELPAGVHLATNYTDRMGVPARVRQAKQLARQLAGE